MGVRLLSDLRDVFGDRDALATEDILAKLHELPESPWADVRGKPLNDRGLAFKLRRYDIKPKVVGIGQKTPRGYLRSDFIDAWRRYLPSPPHSSATSAESRGLNVTSLEEGEL